MFFNHRMALLASITTVAVMHVPVSHAGDWQHQAGITGFVFAMDGTAGVGGKTADVDVSMSDMVDHLQDALTGLVRGSNGTWGYWASYETLELGGNDSKMVFPEVSNAKLRGEISIETVIVDAGLTWNVPSVEWLELIAGVRQWDQKQTLELDLSTGVGEADRQASINEKWTDGFVGVRATVPINEAFSYIVRLDAGAGDSDATYQALALLNYSLTEHWNTAIGYRFLKADYEQDGFVFDMDMSGVEVGVTYTF